MESNLEFLFVNEHTKIKEVLKIIDDAPTQKLPAGIAFVVNDKKQLIGVVTDGDIRKAIIKEIKLDEPVKRIMHSKPFVLKKNASNKEIYKLLLKTFKDGEKRRFIRMDHIIIVDDFGKVDNLMSFYDIWAKHNVTAKKVCVLGLGYVGLTLALTLANHEFEVCGVDINKKILDIIKSGHAPFHEVGINTLLKHVLNKNFKVSDKIPDTEHEIYIIAVGTPINNKKEVDYSAIKSICESLSKVLKKDDLVVLRSTVPIGSSRNFILPILEKGSNLKAGADFSLVFAPERTIEGKALSELKSLPQIIGGIDKNCAEYAANFFREITPSIILVDTLEEAEMVKLMNNTYRDVTFAYANELVGICEKYNIESKKLINAANEGYPRSNIPSPSPGVGGVCLKKDAYILMESLKKFDYSPALIKEGRQINENMPKVVYQKLLDYVSKQNKKEEDFKIFIIGFAFKGEPETSDLRDSTTIDFLNLFSKKFKKVFGYDPIVAPKEIEKLGVKHSSLKDGFKDADCVFIMNNHKSYLDMDIFSLLSLMKKPALFFDGWSMFDSDIIKGITYSSLGYSKKG